MRKSLFVLAGLSAALFIPSMAHGVFTGLTLVKKEKVGTLQLINLFASFSVPGETLLSINGLISPNPIMTFSTNSAVGFHQEQLFGSDRDFAVSAGELGFQPSMGWDTYFNVGIKSGEVTTGGFASGAPGDYSSSTPVGITFGWNGGGKLLSSDGVNGGSFVLIDLAAPITDQNISGSNPLYGNDIFLAQLVVDQAEPTNDGLPLRVDIVIPDLIWQDAAGGNHQEGFNVTGSPLTAKWVVPAPGTLALLGLAGLAGIRRRRR
jgi:hypothetical protein